MYFHFPTFFRVVRQSFSKRHFHPRHIVAAALLMWLFLIVRGIVWCARGLDRIFFSRYRRQPIVGPLFITGSPRSGTTFLHRLLSHDPQFTSTRLIHTVFPAVVFYKLIAAIRWLDPRLGRPFSRLARWIERKGFTGWRGIHRTRLNEPEEDEQYFVYTMLTPVVTLLFPFFEDLEEPCFVDDMSGNVQDRLMAYYRDCIQRHLYAKGSDKTLLTKNTMLTGRLEATRNVLTDMRLVHIVRHPFEAIPSLLSLYDVPWKRFAPQTQKNQEYYRKLASLFLEYYRRRLKLRDTWPSGQFVEVQYQDLVTDPEAVVTCVYRTLELRMSDEFKATLHAEAEKAKGYHSTHRYSLEAFGLTCDFIYERIPEVFEAYGFKR